MKGLYLVLVLTALLPWNAFAIRFPAVRGQLYNQTPVPSDRFELHIEWWADYEPLGMPTKVVMGKIKVPIRRDGTYLIPAFNTKAWRFATQHRVRVTLEQKPSPTDSPNKYILGGGAGFLTDFDQWKKQGPALKYYASELQNISLYGFKEQDVKIEMESGESFVEWLNEQSKTKLILNNFSLKFDTEDFPSSTSKLNTIRGSSVYTYAYSKGPGSPNPDPKSDATGLHLPNILIARVGLPRDVGKFSVDVYIAPDMGIDTAVDMKDAVGPCSALLSFGRYPVQLNPLKLKWTKPNGKP